MNEGKIKLAQAMAVPHKNCREYQIGEKNMQEHTHNENCSHASNNQVIIKHRGVGPTGTVEQMQEMMNLLGGRRGAEIHLPYVAFEKMMEKRAARLQENVKLRRIRKSVKNKALKVAKSQRDRHLIARGATAQQIQSKPATVACKSARALRREGARKMAKLSRKFATQTHPAQES